MIFFTNTFNDDELETEEEEMDDSEKSLDDEVLDEIGDGDESDDEETEGFGLVDDDADKDDDSDDDGEDEDDMEEDDELEEDAEEMDYDRFDDVDEM